MLVTAMHLPTSQAPSTSQYDACLKALCLPYVVSLMQTATSAAAVNHPPGLPSSMSIGPTIQSGVPGSSAPAHRNAHATLPQVSGCI